MATIEDDALDWRRQRLRETEIEKLDPRLGDHDIVGLEIAMDDAAAMGFIERVGDLCAVF